MALVSAVSASAHDGEVFTFEGAGWGHGVGMSQWGAYGQARDDPTKRGEEIAAYYYPGSEPGRMSDLSLPNDLLYTLENPIWVNLGSRITLLEFTAVGGPLELCLVGDGEGPCPKPEQPQEGERWEFRRIERNECGFFLGDELQGTTGGCRASISWPDAAGVQLRHGEERTKICAARTGYECEYRHGELKIRDDPEEIGFHVVLAVGLEDYIRGIAEILDHWEEPGINEAQAVAARSYAAFKFFQYETGPRPDNPNVDPGISGARKDSCWCHLYDNTRDMQYVAWAKESRSDAGPWLEGVEATRDRVLTYFGPDWERYTKGGIVQAFFSTSSGGFSRSNRYGFFTEWNENPRAGVRQWPYLEPVEDPWDVDPVLGNPHASWERRIAASKIAGLLGWEEVTDATLTVSESASSPARVRFDGTKEGSQVSTTVAGAWLWVRLGLKSSNIVAIDGESPDPSQIPPDHEETLPEVVPDDPPADCVGNDGFPLDIDECLPYDDLPLFEDAVGSVHADGIQAILNAGITRGCGDGTRFCTYDPVTRGAMATLLLRAMDLEPVEGDRFSDVLPGNVHRGAIYAIAELGLTTGCGDGTRFCPDQPLTRAVMAVFLARALDMELRESADGPAFTDVTDTHPQRGEIYAIADQEITLGCGGGDRFCPDDPVTRGAMATFLARAFIWDGPSPPSGYQ